MEVFSSADLQRASGDVQRAATAGPVIVTNYDRPALVLMSYEHYDSLRGSTRFAAGVDSLPDTALARLEALAAECPDDVELFGDLESISGDETDSSSGPHP